MYQSLLGRYGREGGYGNEKDMRENDVCRQLIRALLSNQ